PTNTSWPLLAPARPTLIVPPTTARPGPRGSASWPIWSAAATAAAACGSGALPGSPPTSPCWPPRSTWLGWAGSACTGPPRMAGQQHEPTATGSRARRQRAPPAPSRRPIPRAPTLREQHARPLRNPDLNGPFHTSHLAGGRAVGGGRRELLGGDQVEFDPAAV